MHSNVTVSNRSNLLSLLALVGFQGLFFFTYFRLQLRESLVKKESISQPLGILIERDSIHQYVNNTERFILLNLTEINISLKQSTLRPNQLNVINATEILSSSANSINILQPNAFLINKTLDEVVIENKSSNQTSLINSLNSRYKAFLTDPNYDIHDPHYRCVNIYLPSWSAGLSLDASVYNAFLESKIIEGWQSPVDAAMNKSLKSSKADLYIEQTPGKPYGDAYYRPHPLKREIWWMPNAEFSSGDHLLFPNVTLVFAKTKHVLDRLLDIRKDHPNKFLIYYSKHTSNDMYLPKIKKDYSKILHMAGTSGFKNTKLILDVWLKHPEWPKIVILARLAEVTEYYDQLVKEHNKEVVGDSSNIFPNIQFIRDRQEYNDLKRIMNEHGLHLCPSKVEGYGHYVNEARSTKAVVLTGNISPTNELISSSSGILVGRPKDKSLWGILHAQELNITFHDLESGMLQYFNLKEEEKRAMGEMARKDFLSDKLHFSSAMTALNSTICNDNGISSNSSIDFLKYIYPKEV